MVSSNNRTLLFFSTVLILLLILASICIFVGFMLISPMIEEQLSGVSDTTDYTAGNLSGKPLAYISSPADSVVRVVDPSTKKVIATIRFDEPPSLAIPSPDGDLYVAADTSLYIVDTGDLKTIRNITFPGSVQRIAFSPDGSRAYVEYANGDSANITVLDTSEYTSIGTTSSMPGSQGNDVATSPDGKYLYVTNYDMNTNESFLSVIDAGSGVTLKDTPIAPDPKYMRITPDGRYLYICFGNAPVEVVNTKTLWVEGNLGFVGNSVEFSK
jgi:DNA-binding beta-propeller fold protein YncE